MATLARSLDALPEEVRTRVLTWARARYAPTIVASSPTSLPAGIAASPLAKSVASFNTLAEFVAACSPDTDPRRVLVAATFITRRENADDFASAQVNAQLKHLGHRVDNITRAIDALISEKPALVIQVRKSGSTRQARKLYRVTDAGAQEVQRMLRGDTA